MICNKQIKIVIIWKQSSKMLKIGKVHLEETLWLINNILTNEPCFDMFYLMSTVEKEATQWQQTLINFLMFISIILIWRRNGWGQVLKFHKKHTFFNYSKIRIIRDPKSLALFSPMSILIKTVLVKCIHTKKTFHTFVNLFQFEYLLLFFHVIELSIGI